MSFWETDVTEGAGDHMAGRTATGGLSSLPQASLFCPPPAQPVATDGNSAAVSLPSLGSLSDLATNSAASVCGAHQQSLHSLLLPSQGSCLASLARQQPPGGALSSLAFASQQRPECRTLGSLTSNAPSLTALSSNALEHGTAPPRSAATPSLAALSHAQLGNRAQSLASATPSLTSLASATPSLTSLASATSSLTSLAWQQGGISAAQPLAPVAPSLASLAQPGNCAIPRPLPPGGAATQASPFPSLSALTNSLPENGASQCDEEMSVEEPFLLFRAGLSTAAAPGLASSLSENTASEDEDDMSDEEDFLPLKAAPSTPAVPMKPPSMFAQVLCYKLPRREAPKPPMPQGKNVHLMGAPGTCYTYYLDAGDITPFDFSTPSPDEICLQKQKLGK